MASLNPYCIGSSNHAEHFLNKQQKQKCLNPYCIGSSNHASFGDYEYSHEWVSLNPYCIGSSNHALQKSNNK